MSLEADTPRLPIAETPTTAEADGCLAGGGEMGALMRAYDWAASPLGPVASWPHGLKTAVRIMLTSRFAMWMGWGDKLTFLYNDAYGQMTLGEKHPWALGKTAQAVWAEIWEDIEPRIESVIESGETTWDEALMLFLERSGYREETYHTFSYSPLSDDDGKIAGMLCVVNEETERVIGERRLGVLREAGIGLSAASTEAEIFAAVGRCIEAQPQDLPFTLTYLLDDSGETARLVTTTGVPAGHPIAVAQLAVGDPASPWPLSVVQEKRIPIVVENLFQVFPDIPKGPWDTAANQAVVVSFARQGQDSVSGFLVAGLNPYRLFDAEYRGFIALLGSQIAASLANARAYEQERRRAEGLAELDRAKTAFFSNISHEFRTPLTLMLGPLEDLLAHPEPTMAPENQERLNVVHRNGLRLLKLVNALLDFTRIEAGRVQARFEPTDIASYTAELTSLFRSAVEKAGMRLIVDCPPLDQPVYLDREMWEKVVLNLLSNAFKFTLEGEIEVQLRAENGRAVLRIRDTGTGIPEEQLPHIFERFHRVEGVRARTHEGTGIGLALVQELVTLHGGTVGVESAYGDGTTFTIALPFGRAHLAPERTAALAAGESRIPEAGSFVGEALRWLPGDDEVSVTAQPGEGQTPPADSPVIVLADDNPDMREYMQRLLLPHYRVIAVADGDEALRVTRESRPDLVLSDVMMPKRDGFGLLQALRSDPNTAGMPVILISARAGEESRIEGLSAGADDYLVKPFSARELLARVASHLELTRVRREAENNLRRHKAEVETLNAQLQRAMLETHHRVKNNLQIISALIDMQRGNGEDTVPATELERLSGNVRALAVIHDILTQEARAGSDQETLSVRSVLERLLEGLQQAAGNRTLVSSLEDTRLVGRQATAVALVTNELVSNALKHGRGTAEIRFRAHGDRATLEVDDDGKGFPVGFDSQVSANTGLELVENIVRWDLRGEVTYGNRPQGGAHITVTFPTVSHKEITPGQP